MVTAEMNPKIGVVTHVSGKVLVKLAEGTEHVLKVGDVIHREDAVRVAGQGGLKVLMSDGTIVDITGELPFLFHDYLLIERSEEEQANRPSVDSIQKIVLMGEDADKIVEKYMCKIQPAIINTGFGLDVVESGKYQSRFGLLNTNPNSQAILNLPPEIPPGETGLIRKIADLSVEKFVDNKFPDLFDNVTFTVIVKNLGFDTATNVKVSDILPAGLNFISATPSVGNYSGGVWSVGTVPVGTSFTLTIVANVGAPNITINIATIVSSDQIDPNLINNVSTNTSGDPAATVSPKVPDLSIVKDDTSNHIGIPGTQATFILNVSNSGTGSASNIVVTDTIPAGFSVDVAATNMANALLGVTISISGNTVTYSSLNLLSGQNIVLYLTGSIDPSTTGNLINTASVNILLGDSTPNNNISVDTLVLTPKVDLSITKTDNQTNIVPGTEDTYTIVVSNSGPSNVVGANVSDIFPAAFTGVSWTAEGSGGANGFSITGSGNINDTVNIPVGGFITYTVTGTISASATGLLVNTATVTPGAGETDTNSANNTITDIDTLTPQVDLSITKTDNQTSVVPGTLDTYTIIVSNTGPSDVVGARVSDLFPAAFTNVTWTAVQSGGANGSGLSGSGNINDIVNIPVGAFITYTVTGMISADVTGVFSNTATVTAGVGETDINTANNSATDTDTLSPQCDLSIIKSVENLSGNASQNIVTYTIVINNTGPSSATDVNVADVFSPADLLSANVTTLSLVSLTQGGFTAGTGAWSVGTLGAGGTATLVFTATIKSSPEGSLDILGDINNIATVNSATLDTDTANNTSIANVLHQVVWMPDAANTASQDPVQNQLLGNFINGYALSIEPNLPASLVSGIHSGDLAIQILEIPTIGLIKYFDGNSYITVTSTDITNHLVLTVSEFNSLVYVPDNIFSPTGDFGQFKYGLFDGTNETALGIVDINTVAPIQPFSFDEITVGDRSHPLTSGQDAFASITITQDEINSVIDFSNGSVTLGTDFQKSGFDQPIPVSERPIALNALHQEVSVLLNVDGVNFNLVTQTSNDPWTIGSDGFWTLTLNFDDITAVSNPSLSLATYLTTNIPQADDIWTVTYDDHMGGSFQARFVSVQFTFNVDARADIVVNPTEDLNISGVNEPNVIYGSTGDDHLTGGLSHDIVIGREGNDTIGLVNANDTVKYNTILDGTDILNNFNTGDKLDLTALFDSLNIPVGDRASKVQVVNTATNTVDINVDTAAAPGFDLHVATIHTAAPLSITVGQDVIV